MRAALLSQARRAYVTSYKLDPDNPETYTMYGATFALDGEDPARGITTLEHAHSLLPASLEVRYRLAELYARVERNEEARSLLESVLTWGHDDPLTERAQELFAQLDEGDESDETDVAAPSAD